MKYLKIIKNKDIFSNSDFKKPEKYIKRNTVKAIIFNKQKKIALTTINRHNFYLLPGGEALSKNLKQEIKRECIEEINYTIDIFGIIGKTKEFRDRDKKLFITTCFWGKTIKKSLVDYRTEEEKINQQKVIWVDVKKLKSIFKRQIKIALQNKVDFYNATFNILRDGIFMEEWLKKNN